MRRWVISLSAAMMATAVMVAPAGAAPGDRLSKLLTGDAAGTTAFDGSGCPQIHHFFRGSFESDDGRLQGTLAIDLCVTLTGDFPASGTFSLETQRGAITGTATTEILDAASVITLVVTDGTKRFSNVSGTIEVDILGFISAFDPWTAEVSANLTNGPVR